MSLRLDLDPSAARQRLRGVVAALDDRERLHRDAARAVTGWIERNFDQQGALATETSAGWPPLARATLAARRHAGLGSQPLQATGRLRAGTRAAHGRASARIENPVPYGMRHQEGRGVPARPFFPTRRQVQGIAARVATDFVRQAVASATGRQGAAPSAGRPTTGEGSR